VLIGQVIEDSHALCVVSTWPTRNKNIYAENLIYNLTKCLTEAKYKQAKNVPNNNNNNDFTQF